MIVVIWLWVTSYMTVARKKTPLNQLGFFIITSNERITTQFPKKVTQLLFVLVSTGVWTQKPCVLNGPVLLFGYWAGQCVSPRRPASQSGPTGFPFHFLLCGFGGAHKRAHARGGRARRDPHTNGCVAPCRHSDLTRFIYGGAIAVHVPTRISAESCCSWLHMFIPSNVRSIISSILKG